MSRRRPRLSAAATVALVFGAGVVVGPLHLLVEEHQFCPVLGQLVHSHGGHDSEERHGVPTHDHQDDACCFAILLDAPGTDAPTVSIAPTHLPAVTAELPRADGAREYRSIPLMELAPKTSPPAA